MGGGLTDGKRSLVRAVLEPHWNPAESTADPAELAQAIAELEQPPSALKHVEPGLDGQMARLVEDTLRPIGAAIDPRIAPEQAKVWRKAMLLKLSDIPGPILVKATRKTLHDPFEFFSQVETVIRKHAAEATKRQEIVLWRLKRWQAEMERLANPLPAIEAPPPEPVTQDEVDGLNRMMRSIGSATRWRLEDGEAVMETGPSDQRRAES